MCQRASRSIDGVYWESSALGGQSIGESDEGVPLYPEHSVPFLAAFGCCLRAHEISSSEAYVVGFSLQPSLTSETKILLLKSYAHSICIGAFHLADAAASRNRALTFHLSDIVGASIVSAELDSHPGDVNTIRDGVISREHGLRATSQTMHLVCAWLKLDIVELWQIVNGDHRCVFIHAEDSVLKLDPNIVHTYNYFPGDGDNHQYSPKVKCRVD